MSEQGFSSAKPENARAARPERMAAPEERLDDLLSNAEIEEIRKRARAKFDDEERKKRATAFLDEEMDRIRREQGTMPQDEVFRREMEQEEQIYIDIPRLRKPMGGELEPDPIILDQRRFFAGYFYTVTRAEALYLHAQMDAIRRHILAVEGRSKTSYNPNLGTMMYQGGTAWGGPNGPGFDGIHRRPGPT